MKGDQFSYDFINSKGQLYVQQWGDTGNSWWWPLLEFCVQTGCISVDVCGMRQPMHFDNVKHFRDDNGTIYDPEEFYLEKEA